MSTWVARDKNGALYLYDKKPTLGTSKETDKEGVFFVMNGNSCQIGHYFFPEVTYDNSPQEVETLGSKNIE